MYKRRVGLSKPPSKRGPLVPLQSAIPTPKEGTPVPCSSLASSPRQFFKVLWCKASGRKNKKWEEDALLVVEAASRTAILKSADGSSELCRGTGMKMAELSNIEPGVSMLSFGGKEIQILEEITSPSNTSKDPDEAPSLKKPMNKRIHRIGKPMSLTRSVHENDPAHLFVMPRPPPEMSVSILGTVQDVVVDPRLAKVLRSHQKEGVLFMYKCLMGFRTPGYSGVILADEMGLGKTLQTITLVYTLLKQSPWSSGGPIVKRCLILAPSSLLGNWKEEFNKWLGPERLKVFLGESSSCKITEYIKYPNEPVVILSYEMFVRCFEELSRLDFQLLIADEGHRLKNSSIKASTLIQSMKNTEKRIILTGTPVQNDLKEFYALVSIVNPNILGSSNEFVRCFESPIVRSKQPNASPHDIAEGNSKMEELSSITEKFILRRTQDVISSFLPTKTDNVLFCAPSPLQIKLYEKSLETVFSGNSLNSDCVFTTIINLRKICNDTSLILGDSALKDRGSKIEVVSSMLNTLKPTGEKVVIVSISTKVLDALEKLCNDSHHSCLRLDGTLPGPKRQSVVKQFNGKYSDAMVLLLSSKAGGTGLNLIGASRIIMYDLDWNPSHDIQAMARVWRDGQTKPVSVYRLLTTGTIEEKIFQRQVMKQGLGDGVVDAKTAISHFTQEELRDLFTLTTGLDNDCETHQLLSCTSCSRGVSLQEEQEAKENPSPTKRKCQLGQSSSLVKKQAVGSSDKNLLRWKHVPIDEIPQLINDPLILGVQDFLTFLFQNKVNETSV